MFKPTVEELKNHITNIHSIWSIKDAEIKSEQKYVYDRDRDSTSVAEILKFSVLVLQTYMWTSDKKEYKVFVKQTEDPNVVPVTVEDTATGESVDYDYPREILDMLVVRLNRMLLTKF